MRSCFCGNSVTIVRRLLGIDHHRCLGLRAKLRSTQRNKCSAAGDSADSIVESRIGYDRNQLVELWIQVPKVPR
jgi:hypothetical protein